MQPTIRQAIVLPSEWSDLNKSVIIEQIYYPALNQVSNFTTGERYWNLESFRNSIGQPQCYFRVRLKNK